MPWGDAHIPAVFAKYPIKPIVLLCRSHVRASARFPSEMTGEDSHKLTCPRGPGDHSEAALPLPSHVFPPCFHARHGGREAAGQRGLPGTQQVPGLLLSCFPCRFPAHGLQKAMVGERRNTKLCLQGTGWGRLVVPGGTWGVLRAGALCSRGQTSPRSPSPPPPV